jgi:hypothetical protein
MAGEIIGFLFGGTALLAAASETSTREIRIVLETVAVALYFAAFSLMLAAERIVP